MLIEQVQIERIYFYTVFHAEQLSHTKTLKHNLINNN